MSVMVCNVTPEGAVKALYGFVLMVLLLAIYGIYLKCVFKISFSLSNK